MRGRAGASAPANPWMSFYLRNKPAAYDVDQTAGTTSVWQQLAQPRPSQEQLRRDRLQQGARHSQAAQLSRRRLGVSGRRAQLPRRARVRQRDVAGSARVDRRGVAPIARANGDANTSCAPECRSSNSISTWRTARSSSLALVQRPAQKFSGRGVWPMKTEVALWSGGQLRRRFPSKCAPRRRSSPRRPGSPAPDFVFANLNDNAYGLVLLDPTSVKWLEAHVGDVRDPFLRAMLWGAMWDLVRDAGSPPRDSSRPQCASCPAERDEQIAAGIVGATEPRGVELSVGRARVRRHWRRRSRSCSPARRTRRRLRSSQESARRVHRAGANAVRDRATHGVARQRVDGRRAAAPTDALVHRHPSRRARCTERRAR